MKRNVLFCSAPVKGQLCKEGKREISLLPPSVSYYVASHCSIVALVPHGVFAVVSCHCSFLVHLKSERGYDTAIRICSRYSVEFFMVFYHFSTVHSHLDKKTSKQTSFFSGRVK